MINKTQYDLLINFYFKVLLSVVCTAGNSSSSVAMEEAGSGYFDRLRKVTLVDGETYFGYIKDKSDAVLIIEACRRGYLPLVRERLNDFQRESIRCGSVYVFHETTSGIKRWTDGLVWTASRNLLGFIHYREIQKHCSQKYSRSAQSIGALDGYKPGHRPGSPFDGEENGKPKPVGSKPDTCKRSASLELLFKPNGFHKKCISYELQDGIYHLIAYTRIPDTAYPEFLVPSNIRAFQIMKLSGTIAIPVTNRDAKHDSPAAQSGDTEGERWPTEKENIVLTSLQRLAAAVKQSRAREIGPTTVQPFNHDQIEVLKIQNLLNNPIYDGKYTTSS